MDNLNLLHSFSLLCLYDLHAYPCFEMKFICYNRPGKNEISSVFGFLTSAVGVHTHNIFKLKA